MIKVGLLYDSISENTGDKAIGITLREFCEQNNFDYEVVNPFDVDPARYSTLLIGGGHIIRDKGDEFYDNFRVRGSHVLVAAGLTTNKDLDYLSDYKFVSVRSKREHEETKLSVEKAKIMPCTTMLMQGGNNAPEIGDNAVGIHITSSTLAACPEIKEAIDKISLEYSRVYFPFTHYNKDGSLMEHSGLIEYRDTLLPELDPSSLFSAIGKMKFIITSSLHATIFAYAQNVPFITFNQDQKIIDFLKDRGLENQIFSSTSELADLIQKIQQKRFDFSSLIKEDKKIVKKRLDEIRSIIEADGRRFRANSGVDKSETSSMDIELKTAQLKMKQLENVIAGRDVALINLQKPLNNQKREIQALEKEIEKQTGEINLINQELSHVYGSRGWRAIMLLREVLSPVKRRTPRIVKTLIRKTFRFFIRIIKGVPFVSGLKQTIQAETSRRRVRTEREQEYQEWFSNNWPSQQELQEQRRKVDSFSSKPLISIVVPTYNTAPKLLKACIESVLNQTYSNWQLCIADDASTDDVTRKIIKEYASQDSRINSVFRKKNGHICKASNSALKLAEGEYVALLDHDDELWPNALFEIVSTLNEKPKTDFIYTDEDKINEDGSHHSEPFFKPDWSPDYLRAVNYITHFAVIRKSIIEKIGGFREGYEGTQDWDLFLRASRETDNIVHIPKVLYSWRISPTSTAGSASVKEYAYLNQKKALEDDATQRGYTVDVKWEIPYLMWRVKYDIIDNPLVSIVIPTKDSYDYISTCLKSLKKTTYKNVEIVVVDTGSADPRVWKLYERYKKGKNPIKVIEWNDKFNFSAVCNFGAEASNGEYLLFLNNDTEVISRDWIEGLLEHAQRPEVGAVGCKLLYPEKKLQHAGVILGVGGNDETPGVAGHFFPAFNDNPPEDPAQDLYAGGVRNFAAVTAACVMVSKEKFDEVEGFDPEFQIAFNDVDFCLKLYDKGWFNIYTPHIKLYHHESISVGKPGSKQRDTKVFDKEIALMGKRWGWELINNDPYYHPEFRRDIASARLSVKKD